MFRYILFAVTLIQYGKATEKSAITQLLFQQKEGACPGPSITFFLYTKNYSENPEKIELATDPTITNLNQTAFEPGFPTKIIIHGYNSHKDLGFLVNIRREYLRYQYVNIFAVDWSPLAGGFYFSVIRNIKHVGECTGLLIQGIRNLGAENIHIIGFSLGAHIPNYIASYLQPYQLPRITGLDPAMPGFTTTEDDETLDKNDAKLVDVLHTNAFLQGTFRISGHVDFFINGGTDQPGCDGSRCNHHRALKYFAESINTKIGFWAWPCKSQSNYSVKNCPHKEPQIIMGEHIDLNSTGVYAITTKSKSPYAKGKN